MGNENYKKLGIIGGLGPAATATLFARVIDLTEAETDQDHLDITILNRPQTPDRTAFILGKSDESYLPPLHEAALELEDLGCEVLATPCVTGHYRSDEWSAGLQTAHLVHMPRETARYLALAGKRCVGIMATDGTGARARAAKRARGVWPESGAARCRKSGEGHEHYLRRREAWPPRKHARVRRGERPFA